MAHPLLPISLTHDRTISKTVGSFLVGFWSFIPQTALARGYPTIWKMENQSSQTVLLTCLGQANGLAQPIVFPLQELTPSKQDQYTWGGWHNDGVGLNGALWRCTLQAKETGTEIQTQFKTEPGENSLLVIRTTSGKTLDLIRLNDSQSPTALRVNPTNSKNQ